MIKIIAFISVVLVLVATFILVVKNNNRGNEVIRSGVHNINQKVYKGWYSGFSWKNNKITVPSFDNDWSECKKNKKCLLKGEKAIKDTTNQLIKNLWFRQQFAQNRLDFDENLYQTKYNAFVKSVGDYKKFLVKTGLRERDVKTLIRDRVYADLVIRNELLSIQLPTDQNVLTKYNNSPDKKYSKEKRDVNILVFRTESAANQALNIIKNTNNWQEALDTLPAINKQVKNTYSFTRSAIKKDSIFKSEAQKVYGPIFIPSQRYWIIYQITNIKPSHRIKKEEALSSLKQEMVRKKIKKENAKFQASMFETWKPRTECEPRFATFLCFNSITSN